MQERLNNIQRSIPRTPATRQNAVFRIMKHPRTFADFRPGCRRGWMGYSQGTTRVLAQVLSDIILMRSIVSKLSKVL